MIDKQQRAFYNTYEVFKAELDSEGIPENVVCYIKDKQLIYTHGVYFNGAELFGDLILLRTFTELDESVDSDALKIVAETDTVSVALAKLYEIILNNEETVAAMGVNLDSRVKDPLPVNTILASPSTIGNPFGSKWLLCNGSKVYAADYPDLKIPDSNGVITLPNISETDRSYYIKVLK